MTVLKELAKQAIRYGLKPEDRGPPSTFADLEYMKGYIRHIRDFEAPASYGVSAVHRERARREWRKLIAKVRATEAPERQRQSGNCKSHGQAVRIRRASNSR
jgi:hypothetical protein